MASARKNLVRLRAKEENHGKDEQHPPVISFVSSFGFSGFSRLSVEPASDNHPRRTFQDMDLSARYRHLQRPRVSRVPRSGGEYYGHQRCPETEIADKTAFLEFREPTEILPKLGFPSTQNF
jgi:hypothetical protein